MKKIEAIIQPKALQNVQEELIKIGIKGMTVIDAQGYGRQKGFTETYRGMEYTVNLIQKIYLLVVVNDEDVSRTVTAIAKAAKTGEEGKIGDGKIFISSVDDVMRIRTGEHGNNAI